ncbi:hypothetical protein INT44_006585 [Umbelopsis vinacea]|uniref:Reverse transcriptase zinc-binding domain-containing protein n=1 Tax=Umbelopsis vinacea TaxID=44442 RepID=A0A8H7UFH7_9FUNG|nr:hypothetical protein INT44_006585 [Umbelopsis vinacea]
MDFRRSLWAMKRNRWRWLMQLQLEVEPEEDLNALVVLTFSWIPEIEEFRIRLISQPLLHTGHSNAHLQKRLYHSIMAKAIVFSRNRPQPDIRKITLCGICKTEEEDDFHLLMNCSNKWTVWRQALQELLPTKNIDSPEKVWQFLLLTDSKSICKSSGKLTLSTIGLIMVSIWQFHWKCCIEDKKWIPDACLWAIRRNRWRWSMQLNLDEDPKEERDELVAITTS